MVSNRRPISTDEAMEIVAEVNGGLTWTAVASRHGVPPAQVAALMRDTAPSLDDPQFTTPPRPQPLPPVRGEAPAGNDSAEPDVPFDVAPWAVAPRSYRADRIIPPRRQRETVKRYDADARRELLDRTIATYSDVLDERVEEGGISAKEMLMFAEVYKLLDNQARLSEGESTERFEISDHRDRVRESIRAMRALQPEAGPAVTLSESES